MRTGEDTTTPNRFMPWIMIAVVLIYACAFQGARAIYSPDEGRYTDVAKLSTPRSLRAAVCCGLSLRERTTCQIGLQ